jgi:hypothetical protein
VSGDQNISMSGDQTINVSGNPTINVSTEQPPSVDCVYMALIALLCVLVFV